MAAIAGRKAAHVVISMQFLLDICDFGALSGANVSPSDAMSTQSENSFEPMHPAEALDE